MSASWLKVIGKFSSSTYERHRKHAYLDVSELLSDLDDPLVHLIEEHHQEPPHLL